MKREYILIIVIAIIVIPFGMVIVNPPRISNDEVVRVGKTCTENNMSFKVLANVHGEPREVYCIPKDIQNNFEENK